MLVWQWDKFNYDNLCFTVEQIPQGVNSKKTYVHQYAAFDIETTGLEDIEQSVMYVWQLCIKENAVLIGRTWGDFKECLLRIKPKLNGSYLMIMVHNLSYEFQFLSGTYNFTNEEVFSIESRKVVKCEMYRCFEFRDTYRLTNLSLDNFTKRFEVEHRKQSGKGYDYNKIRWPDTPLTHKELKYAVYDVLGLVESVDEQLKLYGDSLYTLPLTQTGYVRRVVKKRMTPYYKKVQDLFPSYTCYKLLRSAFRGGNTHGSRFYAGAIINNVKSVDESSAYPFQQVCKKYPMTPFKEIGDHRISYIEKQLGRGACFVMRIEFNEIRLKNKYWPVPYIPVAKCEYKMLGPHTCDNGRIISAKCVRISITDIDFRIIENEYTWKRATILVLWQSYYDYLPEPIRETNRELYTGKTRRKGIDEEKLYYARDKEMLNSIYGMSCQQVVQDTILYAGGSYNRRSRFDESGKLLDSTERLLWEIEEYRRRKRMAFQVYQWGVYTTCHARLCLESGIQIAGDGFIYCDTDSIKYVGDSAFDEYNNGVLQLASDNHAFAEDKNGNLHYMGVFESETGYDRFCHLGAKKYAYEQNGKLYITISGVPKQLGAISLSKQGGLEAFANAANLDTPFLFDDVDKLESVYNDEDYGMYTREDKKSFYISKNLYLRDTTYKLSVTPEYADIFSFSSKELNIIQKYWLNCKLQKDF